MSEPIKLKNAGEKHTLTVRRVRLLPFGNDPEIEYEGTDGSKVWVPQKSSDRQLARLNLTEETVVGCTITIKRDPNSTKGRPPFWGIYLEEGGNGGAGAAPPGGGNGQPSTAERPASTAPLSGHKLYESITDYVLTKIAPRYQDAGIGLSPEATAAIVATLYIQASKNGH